MNLAELRMFCAVVQEGSVTGAAARLNTVPSNVTTRLRHLAETVGEDLFIKRKQRLYLSEAGERLLPYARRMLALNEEARSAVGRKPHAGRIRIGSMESTAASKLPPVLAAFHRQQPDVHVSLRTGPTRELLDALHKDELDAVFVDLAPHELGGWTVGFSTFPAFDEDLVLVHPLQHNGSPAMAVIIRLPALVFASGCAYRQRLLAWVEQQKQPLPQIIEMASYHAILACVAAGMGMSLVPRSVLRLSMPDGIAVTALPNGKAKTFLVWRHGQTSSLVASLRALLPQEEDPATGIP